MVALVIFSIGLIGLAGLQASSVNYNNGAYQRSQASFLVNDIMDRMRANRDSAINGSYDIAVGTTPSTGTCTGSGANCNATGEAVADLSEWKQALKVLPAGDGSVSRNVVGASTTFIVTIVWNDANAPTGKSKITVTGEL